MHVVAAPRVCPMPCLVGEGLPVAGDPTTRGNLYVRFTVRFPDRLDRAAVDAVRAALGGSTPAAAGPDDLYYETRDADASFRATRAPDEPEDEPAPQQQCHQQ